MLLVNETNEAASFSVYVTNDGDMRISLGSGTVQPGEMTYWREKKDLFNLQRAYRVHFQCGQGSINQDAVDPQFQVSLYKTRAGTLAAQTYGGLWGGKPPS